jgi:hypothetical protein
MKFLSILFKCLFLLLISSCSEAQDLKQLRILEDANALNISSSGLHDLNSFGHYKYALYALNRDQLKYPPSEKNLANYLDKQEKTWLFSKINTETGEVSFMSLASTSYHPLSFISDDTLICRDKEGTSFTAYCISNQTHSSVPDIYTALLRKIPDAFVDYIFKFNQDRREMALLERSNGECIQIFNLRGNAINELKVLSEQYFKTWQCYDIEWIDNNNLLLYLIRVNEMGNGYEYNQKIFNVNNNSVTEIFLPPNSEKFEDINNGNCIIRTANNNRQFIVYSLKSENSKFVFEPLFSISAINKNNKPIGTINFISNNKIILTSNIEGEREIVHLWMNLKEYDFYSTFDIQRLNIKK